MVLLSALCFLIALPASAQEDSDEDEAYWVREQFRRAYQEKDWPKAIEAGLELNRLAPKQARSQYSVACVYALNGDGDKAVAWLGKAAGNGFSQVSLVKTDPDLAAVREHEGYKAALAQVQQNHERELVRLEKRFERSKPLIVLPPEYDPNRKAPLIIALHGYGDMGKPIADRWLNVAGEMGAILVAPDAARRVKGTYGFDWGHIDEAEFLVNLTLESVEKKHRIDKDRIILTGFSQGAYVAYAVGQRHPERFVGVIPMAGGYMPRLDRPTKPVGPRVPRFYFMVGKLDRAVEAMTAAAKDFTEAGYEVEFRVYPDVGHTFPLDQDVELRKALRFVLGGKP